MRDHRLLTAARTRSVKAGPLRSRSRGLVAVCSWCPFSGSLGWVDSVDLELDVVGVAQDDEGFAERGQGGRGVLDSGLVEAVFPVGEFVDGDAQGEVVESGVGDTRVRGQIPGRAPRERASGSRVTRPRSRRHPPCPDSPRPATTHTHRRFSSDWGRSRENWCRAPPVGIVTTPTKG